MSGIQNGSADIRRQLSGVASGNIGTSLTSNLTASLDMSVLTLQNREIVESVRALQGEVITLKDLMASLQVVLDSGVLVGELAGSMDLELGRLTSRKERGVNK
jgi:predicted ATP-dependent Lon-type protease